MAVWMDTSHTTVSNAHQLLLWHLAVRHRPMLIDGKVNHDGN